jgi:hypothetical protein
VRVHSGHQQMHKTTVPRHTVTTPTVNHIPNRLSSLPPDSTSHRLFIRHRTESHFPAPHPLLAARHGTCLRHHQAHMVRSDTHTSTLRMHNAAVAWSCRNTAQQARHRCGSVATTSDVESGRSAAMPRTLSTVFAQRQVVPSRMVTAGLHTHSLTVRLLCSSRV